MTTGERLLVVGDVVNDIIVRAPAATSYATDNPAEITRAFGGSGANQAAWAARLGGDVTFVGRAGAADVDTQIEQLERVGAQARIVADPDHPTGVIVVVVDGTGERTMYVDRGANEHLTEADVPDELVERAGAVHLSGYLFFTERGRAVARSVLDRARRRGLRTSVDPGSAYHLRRVGPEAFLSWTAGMRLCLPNEAEAELLAGGAHGPAAHDRLRAAYPAVVVKRGARGATVLDGAADAVDVEPSRAVTALDTTGAGDAFAGALLSRLGRGWTLPEAAVFAVENAAAAVRRLGARPSPEPVERG